MAEPTQGTVKIPWDYPQDPPERTSYKEKVYVSKIKGGES